MFCLNIKLKADLIVIFFLERYIEFSFKICTYRPSLLLIGKISRNIVKLLESVFRFNLNFIK